MKSDEVIYKDIYDFVVRYGSMDKNEFFIKCSNGLLYPLILQREGKKALKVEEFIKGFKK